MVGNEAKYSAVHLMNRRVRGIAKAIRARRHHCEHALKQRTDPPHALALLRARRERPCRRAAEKANELTSPHIRTQAQGSALYRQTGTLIGLKPASKPLPQCTTNVGDGSFSSDRPAPDALGMSASLRSRPNLRTAAIRRGVP
jgi:hypothetical protein